MLSTGLMHLLPEASEMIAESLTHMGQQQAQEATNSTTLVVQQNNGALAVAAFPWSMLVCGVSVIGLFAIDVLLNNIIFSTHQHSDDHEHCQHSSHEKGHKQETHSLTCMQQLCGKEPIRRTLSQSVLWLSLCVHSISAALAFGMELEPSKAYTLFGAIIGHHIVEAFSYGVILDKSLGQKVWWSLLFYCLTYSALLPIGIGVGMAIATAPHDDVFQLVQGFILSIACGAFLYVALFEVLMNHSHAADKEKEDRRSLQESSKELASEQPIYSLPTSVSETAIAMEMSETNSKPPVIEATQKHNHQLNSDNTQEKVLLAIRFALFCLGFAIMAVIAIWV